MLVSLFRNLIIPTSNLTTQLRKIQKTSNRPLANRWHLTWPLARLWHLNRSVTFIISLYDLFPRSNIYTIFTHQNFALKPRKALISRSFSHLLFSPCYQHHHLHMDGLDLSPYQSYPKVDIIKETWCYLSIYSLSCTAKSANAPSSVII